MLGILLKADEKTEKLNKRIVLDREDDIAAQERLNKKIADAKAALGDVAPRANRSEAFYRRQATK